MSAQEKKLYKEWCDSHAEEIVKYAMDLEDSGEQCFVAKTIQIYDRLLKFRTTNSAGEWIRSRIKRVKDGLTVKGFSGGVPLIGRDLDNEIKDIVKQMSIEKKCMVNANDVTNVVWTLLNRPENACTKAKALSKKATFGSSWVARARARWQAEDWLSAIDFEVTPCSTNFIIISNCESRHLNDVSNAAVRVQKLCELEAQVARERQFVALETERLKAVAIEIDDAKTQLLKDEAEDVENKRKSVELEAQKIKEDAAEVERKRKDVERAEQLVKEKIDVANEAEQKLKSAALENERIRADVECKRKLVELDAQKIREDRKESQLLKDEAVDVENKRKSVELEAQKIKEDAAEVERKRKDVERAEQLVKEKIDVANEAEQKLKSAALENERIRADVECKRKLVELDAQKIKEDAEEVERKRQYVELLVQRINRTKEKVTDLDQDSVICAFDAQQICSDDEQSSDLSKGQSLCIVAPLVNVENSNGTTLTSSKTIVPVLLKRKRVKVDAQFTCADVFKHIDAYLVDKNNKLVRSVNGVGQFEKYIECGYLQIDAEYGSSKSVLGLVQLKFGLSTVAKNTPMVLATSAVDGLLTFSPTEDDFCHCAIWLRKCADDTIHLEIECISKMHNDTIHYVPACTKTTEGCVIFKGCSHELEHESRFVLVSENGTNVRREFFKFCKSKGPFIEKCLSSRVAYFEHLNCGTLSGSDVTSDDVDFQQEDSKRLRKSSTHTSDNAKVRVSNIMALQDSADDVAPEFEEAFKVGGDEAVYALLAKKFTQLNAYLLSKEDSFIRRVSPARNNCMYASISEGLLERYGQKILVGDMKKKLKAFMNFNEAALLLLSDPFLVPVMEVVKDSNGQACLECCSLYRDGFHLRMKEKQEVMEDEDGDPYLRTVCEGGLEGGKDFKIWVDACLSTLGNQTVLQCVAALYGLEILVFTTKSIVKVTHLSIPNLRHKGPPPETLRSISIAYNELNHFDCILPTSLGSVKDKKSYESLFNEIVSDELDDALKVDPIENVDFR